MNRLGIVKIVGDNYLTTNIENSEFSYEKAFKEKGIDGINFTHKNRLNYINHRFIDLRFVNNDVSVLIETKEVFKDNDVAQLNQYVDLEKILNPKNKIIAILADTKEGSNRAKVWKDGTLLSDKEINRFEYYEKLYDKKVNDKEKVLKATNKLNTFLHKLSVLERHRSQLVGSCLIALNNGLDLDYLSNISKMGKKISTAQIISNISDLISDRLTDNENKEKKINLLKDVLKNQDIRDLKPQQLIDILKIINDELIPFIREDTNEGEDLLNLFFTTFNKYVGKADKNQAFTPSHITDFMSDLVHLNKDSRVLDPTCGSGSFLIQAMKKMIADTDSVTQKEKIRQNQIFGIEKDENAFALATTNMLIHKDGKSNIVCASCFDEEEWIRKNNINAILMNPPFNGQKLPDKNLENSKGMDKTKGFYFVHWVANVVNKGYLCTILPVACAIGSDKEIMQYKRKMLEHHTLKAVFSLPDDIFYPGANASACIMLFELGVPHDKEIPVFFGYYKDDGFEKKKNLGRVEIRGWRDTKSKWLTYFKEGLEIDGFSIKHKVSYEDEWLAEAYIKTDYSKLTDYDFIRTIRDFLAYEVKNGEIQNDK